MFTSDSGIRRRTIQKGSWRTIGRDGNDLESLAVITFREL
jgi:hypothetical protein